MTLDNVDAFTVLTPGVGFLRTSGRAHHAASYAFSSRLNLLRSSGNSVSNRADWRSHFDLSPESELTLGTGLHQGHTSAYDLSFPRVVEPFPGGGILFVSGDAVQDYTHRVGRAWQVRQHSGAGLYYPLRGDFELDHSYQVGGGLDLQRRFRYEAITGSVRGRYVSLSRPVVDGVDVPATDQHLVAGAEIAGSRELGHQWSADLGLGAVAVAHIDAASDPLVLPSVRTSLRYAIDPGSATLSYRHDLDTRLATAETSAMHLVQLAGLTPVRSMDGVWLSGAVGYRRGRVLDTRDGSFLGTNDVFLLDGQLSWEFRRGFTASAQLQTHQQRRRELETVPIDTSRSQLMLSLAARFPSHQAARIPPGVGGGSWVDESSPGDGSADSTGE